MENSIQNNHPRKQVIPTPSEMPLNNINNERNLNDYIYLWEKTHSDKFLHENIRNNLQLQNTKSTLNLLRIIKADLIKVKSPLSLKLQEICSSEEEENKILFLNNLNIERRKFNFKVFESNSLGKKLSNLEYNEKAEKEIRLSFPKTPFMSLSPQNKNNTTRNFLFQQSQDNLGNNEVIANKKHLTNSLNTMVIKYDNIVISNDYFEDKKIDKYSQIIKDKILKESFITSK